MIRIFARSTRRLRFWFVCLAGIAVLAACEYTQPDLTVSRLETPEPSPISIPTSPLEDTLYIDETNVIAAFEVSPQTNNLPAPISVSTAAAIVKPTIGAAEQQGTAWYAYAVDAPVSGATAGTVNALRIGANHGLTYLGSLSSPYYLGITGISLGLVGYAFVANGPLSEIYSITIASNAPATSLAVTLPAAPIGLAEAGGVVVISQQASSSSTGTTPPSLAAYTDNGMGSLVGPSATATVTFAGPVFGATVGGSPVFFIAGGTEVSAVNSSLADVVPNYGLTQPAQNIYCSRSGVCLVVLAPQGSSPLALQALTLTASGWQAGPVTEISEAPSTIALTADGSEFVLYAQSSSQLAFGTISSSGAIDLGAPSSSPGEIFGMFFFSEFDAAPDAHQRKPMRI